MSKELEKIIRINGAYDKRDPNPSKNYGIHAVEIVFILKGEKGAVQFVAFTGMHLPHVEDELWRKNKHLEHNPFQPMGAAVGYHSSVARYEGQGSEKCGLLDGDCFYDQSFCDGDNFMKQLLAGGSNAVFVLLEQRYKEYFEGES